MTSQRTSGYEATLPRLRLNVHGIPRRRGAPSG
nr:MAG TPA: hypothetical protein [Caudoviricetes sp.]